MVTILMVMFLVGLTVLLIGLAVKAARMQARPAAPTTTGAGLTEEPEITGPSLREHITDADLQYIEESWKRVEGIFPADPEVALDVAHKTVASVFNAHGLDASGVLAEPADLESASPEELRQQLLRYERVVARLTGAVPHAW
ncbi:MAG: hypothetical protein JF587_18475 [Catenulisporales bacterium]|jgi:hypothetical protein|nr:hypothetical protein [Catenulisporales bacterium]